MKFSNVLLSILFVIPIISGCATFHKNDRNPSKNVQDLSIEGEEPESEVSGVEIREFVISPGDELAVSVLDYPELSRKFLVPPDGHFYYPLVGEIELNGKTLRQFQKVLTESFSHYQVFSLSPGDEVGITVYQHDELNRKLVIPPDSRFFYPLIGEIDTKGKTLSQVRELITVGLSRFIVDPQVSVDMVNVRRPKIIVDPQVSVEVLAFGGQKVFVIGEVNRPGVFTAENNMSLLEAISKAGGFTLDAKQDSVLLINGGMEAPNLTLYNLERFLKGKDLTQNISLQRGDIVYVPASAIANVDRFFRHFANIINPIVSLEAGIVLAPRVKDTFTGDDNDQNIIVPPR